MTIEEYGSDALAIIGMIAIFSYWAGLALIVVGQAKISELPHGIPLVLVPFAAWFQFARNLLRRKRIASFLKLADDLWMRKKRINGFFPRRPRR